MPKIEKKLQIPEEVPANSTSNYSVAMSKLIAVNPLVVIPIIIKNNIKIPIFNFSYIIDNIIKTMAANKTEMKQTHLVV